MGSGKTTLGKKIASLLGLEFIDLDTVITLKEGLTVNQIFKNKGEEYFRQKEKETLEKLIENESFVMAVGGGTPCFFNNMALMNNCGLTIYLKLSPAGLYTRLAGRTTERPLVKNFEKKELLDYININLAERENWYLQSKIIIGEKEQKPELILGMINDYNPGSGLD